VTRNDSLFEDEDEQVTWIDDFCANLRNYCHRLLETVDVVEPWDNSEAHIDEAVSGFDVDEFGYLFEVGVSGVVVTNIDARDQEY
jgi:hypothetical protein